MNKEAYIESADAIKLFVAVGLSESTFRRKVREKAIRSHMPGGKQRGALYNRADIEAIINQSKKDNKKQTETKDFADWMKVSDLPAILKLDFAVYKEEMVGDIGLYISWFKKNDHITMCIFDKESRENVLAYISLVPLPENTIMEILSGQRSELSISPDEVEAYNRKGDYTLLAESIVVHPEHPYQLNHLLREVLNYWCTQYPERQITKIYAQVTSDNGDVIVRKLFFSPLYHIADNAYVLDLKRPGIARVIKEYQQHIKNKDCA
ncbi:hypothetical protein [Dictyobacter aurantiacus]|uniref:Uncharacterized protein n=1 Tax=Dictyobacter aurantiacus TaxID=1936993 RepID=A0A401ZHI4_9CHLR|nr:hypothetical protein [Dictyobacter aurantiacus]GCE06340.1 hypothetical protein KDAU_36690 [Dictyobacter aurantiacus]